MGMKIDLTGLSMGQIISHLGKGDLSSEELVSQLLDVMQEKEPVLDAFTMINTDSALQQARAADKARKDGCKGVLLGVPVAVKDNINVAGQPCGCSSRMLKGYVSPYDATVISRLRSAGAVFVGRTNMDEFAMGGSTENSSVKVTKNPHSRDRVPGGSSGGSAASVAGGSAIVALGSDTGGSIRQPASFCGCVGLKPTYGRVSRYGLVAFASSLDQIGPLTRDVTDSALMLEVMSGQDSLDSTSLNVEVPRFSAELKGNVKGVRIGLPREYFVPGMDKDVDTAIKSAVRKLSDMGAEIVDISLPHTEYAIATYYIIATAEASANLARFDGVRYGFRAPDAEDPMDMYCRTRAAGFGSEVKRRIILGTYVLSSGYYDAYYLTAQKVRTLIRKDFDDAFKRCDAIVTPVTPTTAFKFGERASDPLKMYLGDIFTVTANLAGNCAISVPCGMDSNGLPIGMQLFGPALGEQAILNVAFAFEKARG